MSGKRAIDLTIAALADAQHGVVSRAQLATLGLERHRIEHRVATGRLQPIHRGIYAFGHRALTVEGRWMAAVMVAGDDAVLSHASAGAAWELRRVGAGAIHVTVPRDTGRRRRTGIRFHRIATLEPRETTTVRAIPMTLRRSAPFSTSLPRSRAARSSTCWTSPSNGPDRLHHLKQRSDPPGF